AESPEEAAAELGFVLKPMNCPFHIQIFKSQLRSYRELPMRLAFSSPSPDLGEGFRVRVLIDARGLLN
ncbi:MAG: hypothetical protein BJG00_005405, partial [Limnothrix sp. CACIAM 69d]